MSAAQIATGMNVAMANATRLIEAAHALLEKGDYPLAASLAALAIEEAGKPTILRSLAIARTDNEVAECWKAYRSHPKKNVMWVLPQLAVRGARQLDDFGPLFEEDAEHPYILDQLKQIGFYTDCLGNAHWSIPEETIDKNLASSLVSIARLFARDKIYTETEIELWIKHLSPVWRGPKERMELALVQWYREMQEKGLATPCENEMEKFNPERTEYIRITSA